MEVFNKKLEDIFNEINNNNKKVNYLFGFNGSGKTTLGKYISENYKDYLVFNEDFIAKNMWVQSINDNTGNLSYKESKKNKESKYELFLGIGISKIVKELKELENMSKQISDNIFTIVENNDLAKWFIDNTSFDKSFFFNKSKDNIEYKQDVKKKKNIFEKQEILKQVDLHNYLIKELNKIITEFNETIKMIKKITETNSTDSLLKDEEIDLHKYALDKLSNFKEFTFVDKKFKYDELKKYFEKNKKNISDDLNWVNNKINIIDNYSKELLKKDYAKIIESNFTKKDLEELYSFNGKKIKKYLDEYKSKKIVINEFNKISEYSKETATKELEEKIQENKAYIFSKKDSFEINSLINKYKDLQKKIDEKTKEKKKSSKDNNTRCINNINKYLNSLGYKDIIINLKGGDKQLKLQDSKNNDSVSYFSEGEKKIIAFSFFLELVSIRLFENKKETKVYIDDVFDSNDFVATQNIWNIKLRDIKLKNLLLNSNNNFSKIILSTHDIFVYDSLISDLYSFHQETDKKEKSDANKKINNSPNIPILKKIREGNFNKYGLYLLNKEDASDVMQFTLIDISSFPFYINKMLIIDFCKTLIFKVIKNNDENKIQISFFLFYIILKFSDGLYYRNSIKVFLSNNKYLFEFSKLKDKDLLNIQSFLKEEIDINYIFKSTYIKKHCLNIPTYNCLKKSGRLQDIDNKELKELWDGFNDLNFKDIDWNSYITDNFLESIYGNNFDEEYIGKIRNFFNTHYLTLKKLITHNDEVVTYKQNSNKPLIDNYRHVRHDLDNMMNLFFSKYKK